MKRPATIAIVACAVLTAVFIATKARSASQTPPPPAITNVHEGGIHVYFNPGGGAEDALIALIDDAAHFIDIQSFHFTAPHLAKALIAAKERGVNVRMIIDVKAAHEAECLAGQLQQHKIPVYIDADHHTAHNKIMIFDDSTVSTGSYNFTDLSAEKNAENLLIIEGKPKIAAAYVQNFEFHLGHSHLMNAEDAQAAGKAAKD